jgi:SOS-response transcriptional repressor LexA
MPRQRRFDDAAVLAAIIRLEAAGMSPTIRELAEELGFKSPAPILRYLERLREEGKVSWVRGKARTLRVVAA